MKNKIYVVLPAYNEEESIGKLLKRIQYNMEDSGFSNYQVIVVNDGSADKTVDVVNKCSQEMPIELLNHPVNLGLGATIRDGLYHAAKVANNNDIIITMDADDTHTPGLILRMVRMVREGFDVVIASRYQKSSRIFGLSRFRKFVSYMASLIFRLLLPIRGVKDFTCGFRAYRASILKEALKKYGDKFIDQDGFQSMVDILLKLRKMKGVIFGEVPFILRYDLKEGESKMNVKSTTIKTLKLIAKRKFGK